MARGAHKRLHCIIRGDVQGVGFRWRAKERARELGATGYIRNLPDGRVEVVAEGSPWALEALRGFCYRGPDGARVDHVEVFEEPPTDEFKAFEIG